MYPCVARPTARMRHQVSPPALLDGTDLLQMPIQRVQSPETMQDNRSNWDHMRHMRSHKRQHEPNEIPKDSATHTHLRGSSSAPLTALDPPISLPYASAAIGVHFRPKPEAESLAKGSSYANRRYKTACALETLNTKSRTSLKKTPHVGSALHAGTLIPIYFEPEGLAKGSSFANRIYKTASALETLHTQSRTSLKKPPHAGSALHAGRFIPICFEAEGLAEGSSFSNRIYKTASDLETLHTQSRTSLNRPPHAGSALRAGTLIPICFEAKGLAKGSSFANRIYKTACALETLCKIVALSKQLRPS